VLLFAQIGYHAVLVFAVLTQICTVLFKKAVETIESAVFIAQGELYDLAETEVIVCEEECQMCAGGWPQNAFEYVMEHGGLPLEEDMSYDGSWLLQVSDAVADNSDELK
jgi:Papain family cysteine protease